MQYVSSLGGPRVLLPTQDVDRWIAEIGDEPTEYEGLYGLACSVDDYCGIIQPWGTPILIFGNEPANIYWCPRDNGGLFIHWLAADSLEQLTAFAHTVARADNWTERVEWNASYSSYTLMDTCAFDGDDEPRIAISIQPGNHIIESIYAETENVMTVVQNLRYAR